MSKVLFSHSYFYQFDPKQWSNKTPYPPLGTIWAASCARELGYEVELFDTNLRADVLHLGEIFLRFQPDYFVLYDDGFNYLTKMCLTNMREAALKMIRQARELNIPVFVSSSDSTDHYEKYLAVGATAILIGEGEETLLELLESFDKGDGVHTGIKGIAFKSGNEIIKTAKRPIRRDLDQIPPPAWDLVDINAYKEVWAHGKYPFALNIATTRGCPFKCNWCAKPIYGNRYNARTPEKVVEEIEFLMRQFDTNRFWICDDIFGLKPGWVTEFNRIIQSKQIKIRYKIQSRADLLMEENAINELAESGLYEVWIGAESGSQKILDAMDKGITIDQIRQATRLLQDKGVHVAYFLQFGYSGETKEDISATIQMLRDFRPDDIGISVSYPLPGTKFYDQVKEELGLKQNWSDSDELAMMFKGSFNTNYYKTLHRFVHRMFRRQQVMKFIKSGFRSTHELRWRNVVLLPYHLILEQYFRFQLKRMNNR